MNIKQIENDVRSEIAEALRAEFDDFIASENDEMDVELGEIYRVKLQNIRKILNRKGVKL